jgi:hypothetical protein
MTFQGKTTADLPQPTAKALASRRNGARSRGPKTAAGKARSARNALAHGLRSRQLVLLDDEDPAEFRAFARALQAELAPRGRFQADLVGRIVIAAWRARRADKLEAGVLATYFDAASDFSGRRGLESLGTELIRDNHGPRAFQTVVRYRGSVLAELFRALAALRMLQAGTGAAGEASLRTLRSPSIAPPHDQTNPRKPGDGGG